MKKAGADPKVKKTFLRNYEQKVRRQPKAVHDVNAGPSKLKSPTRNKKDSQLDRPALCSSEALANYLADVRSSVPPKFFDDDSNTNKAQINTKITKKLNFHFNDRIYKNLVELNADVANLKIKKDKRTVKSAAPMKKDVEPNIEDFCQDEKESDMCPIIPDIKHKMKPINSLEDGSLHRLIASFEIL